MPIISNANRDFSNLSVSTDDSSLDRFFTEIPETESVKGVYYKRAQFLREPEALGKVDHEQLALINVGGDRYAFPWSTLDEFPLTRLGQLRFCRSLSDICRLCDDYDEARREYFFDRSSPAFRIILNFLAAGRLRLLREACVMSLWDELNYWGVDPCNMERCCRRRMMTHVEETAERRRRDEELRQRRLALLQRPLEEKGCRRVMTMLRDMVENPESGWLGKAFAVFSVVMITVTVISLCISTMPDLREEERRGECSQKCQHMFIIETICVVWFSLEFVLRFVQARSKLAFARGPLNIIDVVAILPYYISLIVDERDKAEDEVVSGGGGHGYLDKLSFILRVLRALRILYVMRLARHSLGLQTLGLTMQRSTREFGLLLCFLCVGVALFSPLVHLAESELGSAPTTSTAGMGAQSFTSIPATYWWAIISMTTVGYGDMVPNSIPGQLVAFSSIVSGILIMAFPATSIFHRFSRSYQELKHEHELMYKAELKEERIANLAALASEDTLRAGERPLPFPERVCEDHAVEHWDNGKAPHEYQPLTPSSGNCYSYF
ncbi:voltage-gated potassium channel regulatory subunit KCNG4 [Alosa pseudoharengus]|uniref:voltage-gated potassium channel regulatory subunit KCNG4 n=1 Tax=Alosa pseudoharengus TaxID=34774 RepID=UPI003F8ACB6E